MTSVNHEDKYKWKYDYLVVTVTGARNNAGTTSNVFCSLIGDGGHSDPRILIDSRDKAFQRDQINAFKLSFPLPLGNLNHLRIWHNNTGNSFLFCLDERH